MKSLWYQLPKARLGFKLRRLFNAEAVVIAGLYLALLFLWSHLLSFWKTSSSVSNSISASSQEFCNHDDALSFDQSSVINIGSTDRLHNVVRMAMAGLPVSIGIIGGSVSACHGIEGGENTPFGNPLSKDGYPRKVYEWWRGIFPLADHQLANGAARRTDIHYFAYCHEQHLPDNSDLIIVELDGENPRTHEAMIDMEILMRSLLLRPNNPAILLLGHFSPSMQARWGYSGTDTFHKTVADFYKIPYISLKPTTYQQYMSNPKHFDKHYYIDSYLPNGKGHQLLADLVTGYLATEICKVESTPQKASIPLAAVDQNDKHNQDGLPPLISANPNDGSRPPARPFCASADNLMNPTTPDISYGWQLIEDTTYKDEWKRYWHTTIPESRLQIPILISFGKVGIYHHVGPDMPSGFLKCWVDTNRPHAVAISVYSEYHATVYVRHDDIRKLISRLTIIDSTVPDPGAHYVVCDALKDPQSADDLDQSFEFQIHGVFAT